MDYSVLYSRTPQIEDSYAHVRPWGVETRCRTIMLDDTVLKVRGEVRAGILMRVHCPNAPLSLYKLRDLSEEICTLLHWFQTPPCAGVGLVVVVESGVEGLGGAWLY